MQKMYKKSSGFTLVEILVVVGLLGILSIGSIAAYRTSQYRGDDARRRTDLESIRTGLELAKSDSGSYPNAATGNVNGTGATSLRTMLASPIPYINTRNFPADPRPGTGGIYYYQRLSATTYALCARLNIAPAAAEACSLSNVDCNTAASGVQACNYGVVQP